MFGVLGWYRQAQRCVRVFVNISQSILGLAERQKGSGGEIQLVAQESLTNGRHLLGLVNAPELRRY